MFYISTCDIATDHTLFFQVISKIEEAVSKTIKNNYGEKDKQKLTEAIDKAQQEVRNLS